MVDVTVTVGLGLDLYPPVGSFLEADPVMSEKGAERVTLAGKKCCVRKIRSW